MVKLVAPGNKLHKVDGMVAEGMAAEGELTIHAVLQEEEAEEAEVDLLKEEKIKMAKCFLQLILIL